MKSLIPFVLIVGLLLALAPVAMADESAPAGMRCVGKAVVDGREVPIYVPAAAEPVKAPTPVTQPATTLVADEATEEVVVVQAPPAPPATILVIQAPPPAPITINNVNTLTATATAAPAAAPTSESWFAPGSVKYHTPRVMQESVQYAPAPVAACPPQGGGGCNRPVVFAPSVTLVGGDRTVTQVHEHQRGGGWGPAPVREHRRRPPCPPRRR